MKSLHKWGFARLWRRRSSLRQELAHTSWHRTPLLYAALKKQLHDIEQELASRSSDPQTRVALRSHYDEEQSLESQLRDLDPHERYGY